MYDWRYCKYRSLEEIFKIKTGICYYFLMMEEVGGFTLLMDL